MASESIRCRKGKTSFPRPILSLYHSAQGVLILAHLPFKCVPGTELYLKRYKLRANILRAQCAILGAIFQCESKAHT